MRRFLAIVVGIGGAAFVIAHAPTDFNGKLIDTLIMFLSLVLIIEIGLKGKG